MEITDNRAEQKEGFVILEPQTTVKSPAHNKWNLKYIYNPWRQQIAIFKFILWKM